jgi:sn-glycerol 3-phosphate transport system substrate-binding protein
MRLKLLGAVLAAVGILCAPAAQAQTEIQWWHSMGGALGEKLNALATKFNASQNEYKVVPGLQGQLSGVDDRDDRGVSRGSAPHIVQIFEVGTATMMAAKGAIVPVTKVMSDAKEPFDPKSYLPRSPGITPTSRATCCRSRSTARPSSCM